ncbi:MAG: MBL fold metallo-hydrolase, partial [Propionibacteriaceae bacterium]|nr:MBL fold metallo-hydrolase [Propionibacteriaceae bacterium]
ETQTVVLTGDVIFQGTIGRTDLPSADSDEMRASLRWLTTAFPDDTVLLPGHGPGTSLAAEKAHNPYLQPDFLKD